MFPKKPRIQTKRCSNEEVFVVIVFWLRVAGTNAWNHYRHQSNVCHLHDTLLANGVNNSQIIDFQFDDIAHNPLNPFKGEIYHGRVHHNVYKTGSFIDYRQHDKTARNFMDVLRGTAQGKVLQSGSNDVVFVYYSGFESTSPYRHKSMR
jgi:legumain